MTSPRALACAPLCLILAACGSEARETGQPASRDGVKTITAKLPDAEAGPNPSVQPSAAVGEPQLVKAELPAREETAPSPPASDATGSSRYTSLEPASCKLLEASAEGAAARRRCAGAAGFTLETDEIDDRQDIVVVAPDGRRSDLGLPALVAKGSFASLGKLAEWRRATPQQPRTLIVRVNVGPDGNARFPTTSNLVVARLDAPACVVAVIPRGPAQNEKARAIADGQLPACMKE